MSVAVSDTNPGGVTCAPDADTSTGHGIRVAIQPDRLAGQRNPNRTAEKKAIIALVKKVVGCLSAQRGRPTQ